ncbi:hypothetical protein BU24DRAFT_424190 [Aaosphaeria arxii CBS 175.79]|uniref:Uncharacterized protein n=1 Tax=Aaosphaeria arxii CBS 175.79 TaxID=1450172 RepID=A0A6A5XK52_9PLEO|nr:uncharacterized protein BU24DRAFT_424190 [Aaosphaeria arxii CBS 175.79]KAF2013187.1 hypothetical protein BU24DRAFT_424190 [Aaosphaeria arxii CBS 175.79]
MSRTRETPIVIGVGDIINRSVSPADAKEPSQLIHEAILAALEDAVSSTTTSSPSSSRQKLQSAIDSIDLVRTWTWPYPDLPGTIAEKLAVKPKFKTYSDHGGNQPGKLFDEAARRIARGEVRVAVVAGGEALASLSACAAAGKLPPPGWSKPAEEVDSVFSPTSRDLGDNPGAIHDIGAPIHVYPLYENAFRAHRGQSIKANHEESSKLYAEFAAVAEKLPYAWNYGKKVDEKTISTVGKKNRMICFPYPLLMNAFNTINLAGACILTSTTFARALGIPQNRWVYPLAGAGTKDSDGFWQRPDFHSSPSISLSIDAALLAAGTAKAEIDLFDIYSCFPIVPKLAAQHLGIPLPGDTTAANEAQRKSLTLLGGLTSFGGAGNNYSMHALAEMTRAIRDGKGKKGLVLCNGGVLSYQHVVVLSKEARDGGYLEANPLEGKAIAEGPALASDADGEAVVETYTVEFKRDGSPLRGHVVGRLKSDGRRFLANHGDERTLRVMAEGAVEIVGKKGWVKQDADRKGRGLFVLENVGAKM